MALFLKEICRIAKQCTILCLATTGNPKTTTNSNRLVHENNVRERAINEMIERHAYYLCTQARQALFDYSTIS
jgi:hypothetical protein